MAEAVRGVVAREKGAPVSVETVLVPDPGPGEAKVRVQACGVCHTDLHYREGAHQRRVPVPARPRGRRCRRGGRRGRHRGRAGRLRRPQLAGRLRRVPGLPARPALVLLRHPQRQPADDARGRHGAVAGAGHRRVRREDPGRGRAVHQGRPGGAAAGRRPAGLRGDGRPRAPPSTPATSAAATPSRSSAAAGSATRRSRAPGWPGRGPSSRVDVDDRKLAWAKEFGATHTVNSSQTDPVEAIRELTGGFGADVVIEAVGRPETYEQAFYARDLAGTVVLVGVPNPDHAGRPADDRDLRPRRRAQVQLVRRLPARPATSRCSSTCTCRAGCRWTSS